MTAVEADRDLIPALREKFGSAITLVEGDILAYQCRALAPMPGIGTFGTLSYKLVANIPYNITSALLHRFLTERNPPSRMVLMVQREVADRILAKPPDMSLLSVVCQLYAKTEKVTNVPAGAFRPIPKVDSAVICLDPRVLDGVHDPERIIRLAKAAFSSRRKQLHRNLSDAGITSTPSAKAALASLGLPETARAENLTVHNWIQLARLI